MNFLWNEHLWNDIFVKRTFVKWCIPKRYDYTVRKQLIGLRHSWAKSKLIYNITYIYVRVYNFQLIIS